MNLQAEIAKVMTYLSIPEDRFVNVNGINTRYWQMGDRGSKIILLHGGNGSIEFWLYNISVLAQHHQVYAFDMVGAGKSDYPDADYSLGYQAEFLRGLMAALSIDSATLIGNSMGGGVSLQFTQLYPDRVEKLVLVDSMGFGREISLGIRLITLPAIVTLLRPGRWMIPAMLKSNFYNGRSLPPEWIELRYAVFAIPGRNRVILSIGKNNFNLRGVLPQVSQHFPTNINCLGRLRSNYSRQTCRYCCIRSTKSSITNLSSLWTPPLSRVSRSLQSIGIRISPNCGLDRLGLKSSGSKSRTIKSSVCPSVCTIPSSQPLLLRRLLLSAVPLVERLSPF
jgi:pimeloyl-ACP methyl ester carboxylesterase